MRKIDIRRVFSFPSHAFFICYSVISIICVLFLVSSFCRGFVAADISGLSGRLVQAAKQKGSSDNISVIVVFFREPELIARRPLPPAPTSVLEDNTPSMEQQQEEYEKLAAKWGWNESQGGAVFADGTSSWQQQQQPDEEDGHHQQPQNPFDSSSGNPFGNGDQGGLMMAEEEQDNHFYQGAHSSSEFDAVHSPSEFHAINWQQQQQQQQQDHAFGDSFNGSDSAETPEVYDGSTAQWGWKDPEIDALEIEAGRDSAEQPQHFAATSVVPLPDAGIDLDVARDQYEKVAAKWGRELELVDTDVVTLESKSVSLIRKLINNPFPVRVGPISYLLRQQQQREKTKQNKATNYSASFCLGFPLLH